MVNSGNFRILVLLIFSLLINIGMLFASETRLVALADNIPYFLQKLEIPHDKPLYLILHFRETDELNRGTLQQLLLQKGLTLVEAEESAEYGLQVRLTERLIPKKVRTLPVRNELYRESNFIIQLNTMADQKVLDIQNFPNLEKHIGDTQVKGKWYTPYLITFVIGSLVYLLYYGV